MMMILSDPFCSVDDLRTTYVFLFCLGSTRHFCSVSSLFAILSVMSILAVYIRGC